MESRKLVLKNLFTGQQWRSRERRDLWSHTQKAAKLAWEVRTSDFKSWALLTLEMGKYHHT